MAVEGVNCQLYATQWFITLFSYNFPFEVVLRIWDVFMFEGPKIIFRVALALINHLAPAIQKLDFQSTKHTAHHTTRASRHLTSVV